VNPDLRSRLEKVNIQVVAVTKAYCLVGRDNLVALLAHTGSIGSTGVMTAEGLAYLVWREGRAMLAAKSHETPADEAQVEAIRRFSEDLKLALS
jgi:hypothetical protein